jgi:outer membrane protein TolC
MFARESLFAVLLVLLVSPPTRCEQRFSPEGEVLTLEQAIALAVRDNLQIKIATLEVDKLQSRATAERTRRLPETKLFVLGSQLLSPLDFTFPKGVLGTYPNVGPIPDQDAFIRTPRQPILVILGQVNQPLSQQYRIGLALKQLQLGQDIAEQRVRLQQQSLINEVKRSYYAILQTESSLRTTQEAIKLYQELDRLTAEQLVQQVALRSESLEVKIRLARSEYEALTQQDQLASQKEQFNQLLGRDIHTVFNVSPVPPFSRYQTNLAEARERALEQRPEIQEARLKVRQAEMERRLKKSEYIPDISLSFNYFSPQNILFLPGQIASAGLMVNWEPFDWGRKRHELTEKDIQIEQARTGLRDAENAVLIDVNGKFRKLQQTRQLLAVGQLAQEAAREQVRITSNRYAVQAALLRDVLQAQTSLTEANHQYQQALLASWAAKADFEKALGGGQ